MEEQTQFVTTVHERCFRMFYESDVVEAVEGCIVILRYEFLIGVGVGIPCLAPKMISCAMPCSGKFQLLHM